MDAYSTVLDDMYRATIALTNMSSQYWLAYTSTLTKNPNSWMIDFLKPYYFSQTLPQSDVEFGYYLKSEPFLASFSDFIKSVVNLSSKNELSTALLTAASYQDKYFGHIRGNLLELQEMPHEVVYRIDGARVLHYRSGSAKRYRIPLLIVYAPVNRYHIMDIRRGRRIVEQFLLAGFDVFLLDWGKQMVNGQSISHYVKYIDHAISQIKKICGSNLVSILGYSWGGVLSMIYSSLRPKNVANLVLLSAHVDFEKDASILASWFRKLPVDDIAQKFTHVDCRFINLALIMRNPAVHSLDAFRFAIDMNKDTLSYQEFGLDVIRLAEWLDDSPLIPAGFFRDYINKLYQQNQLVKNELKIILSENESAETVDLSKLTMPLLNIIGELDDICTPSAALPVNGIAASNDKELLRFRTGHIELSVSSAVHSELWPRVVGWLKQRSE